jgi:hypothetical protein
MWGTNAPAWLGPSLRTKPRTADGIGVSVLPLSVSVSWAISQYRQVLSVIASRTESLRQIVKTPKESPEMQQYLRSIGIGRNIDVYA